MMIPVEPERFGRGRIDDLINAAIAMLALHERCIRMTPNLNSSV
jgi:hypothetical protein